MARYRVCASPYFSRGWMKLLASILLLCMPASALGKTDDLANCAKDASLRRLGIDDGHGLQ